MAFHKVIYENCNFIGQMKSMYLAFANSNSNNNKPKKFNYEKNIIRSCIRDCGSGC
jgi:hypothetical protein